MKILSAEEFEETVKELGQSPKYIEFKEKESKRQIAVRETMEELENPINAQKSIIAKLKLYVEDRIEDELLNEGDLSNMTRVWSKDVIGMLGDLNTQMYGSKNVNLNLGSQDSVSHGQIANKVKQLRSNVK